MDSEVRPIIAPVPDNVVQLHSSNFRDPVATLRLIADEIEAGDYGDVGSVALVILGDSMECFGLGKDAEAPSIGLLFYSAFLRMAQAIEGHGK
jgi:hypothetical protein